MSEWGRAPEFAQHVSSAAQVQMCDTDQRTGRQGSGLSITNTCCLQPIITDRYIPCYVKAKASAAEVWSSDRLNLQKSWAGFQWRPTFWIMSEEEGGTRQDVTHTRGSDKRRHKKKYRTKISKINSLSNEKTLFQSKTLIMNDIWRHETSVMPSGASFLRRKHLIVLRKSVEVRVAVNF